MEYYKNLNINDIDGELWKEIEGYEGLYWVSNLGRIKSKRISKFNIKKQSLNKGGYLTVKLCVNYVSKNLLVHRIVSSAFIGKYSNQFKVTNHKNNIKTDNRDVNLEICNHSYNNKYSYDFGNKKPVMMIGEKNPSSKCIVKIDLFGNYISEFKTKKEASLDINLKTIRIFRLSKKICSNNGYIFMYKQEYNTIKKNDDSIDLPFFRSYKGIKRKTIHTIKTRNIVQLDDYNNVIEIFESYKLAEKKIGKRGVLDVCRKRIYKDKNGYTKHYNKCGGYNWMYYEDFLLSKNVLLK